MYLAHTRSSCTDGNHQGRIRVATDTYPMSYKGGPGQALRCPMVIIPADMLIRSQLTSTKTTNTHGRRIRTRECTGARERTKTKNKRFLSGRPNKRVLTGAQREKTNKNKTISLGTVRETSVRTVVRGWIKRKCGSLRYETCTRGDPTRRCSVDVASSFLTFK